ncbi:MAG TPA: TetR family transcriptional regulator, partial [Synergistaceae bacterium]|nr:TetR family transcriptional regulator [Synergistaceae bacterium]
MAGTRRGLPADERRSVIIETVLRLAAERNPSEITTAAIAEGMGLTQGALFRHFPNKEAVFAAVVQWVGENLSERLKAASRSTEAPLDALKAMFEAHVRFVAEHPGIPKFVFSELQKGEHSVPKREVRALMAEYVAKIVLLLDKGKLSGDVDLNVDSAAAGSLFLGTLQGLTLQSMVSGTSRDMLPRA